LFIVFADSAKMIQGFAFYTIPRGSVSLNIVAEYITIGGVYDLRGWLTVSLGIPQWIGQKHTGYDKRHAIAVQKPGV